MRTLTLEPVGIIHGQDHEPKHTRAQPVCVGSPVDATPTMVMVLCRPGGGLMAHGPAGAEGRASAGAVIALGGLVGR